MVSQVVGQAVPPVEDGEDNHWPGDDDLGCCLPDIHPVLVFTCWKYNLKTWGVQRIFILPGTVFRAKIFLPPQVYFLLSHLFSHFTLGGKEFTSAGKKIMID